MAHPWPARGGTAYAEFAAAEARAREHGERSRLPRAEFDACLAKAVRGGSVNAMKLWWRIHGTDNEAATADPFDFGDELAKRRSPQRR